jgi:conjugal transfer mating pair stabilization protein TraN
MMRMIVMTLFFLSISSYGGERTFQNSYQKGLKLGKQSEGRVREAMQTHPQSIFKDYNERPKEADYYNKDQTNDNDLKMRTRVEFVRNPLAQKIDKENKTRPKFEIQKNTPSMNMNQWVLDNAYQLTHEKSCKEIPSCMEVFENINCFEKPPSIFHVCGQRLVVDVKQSLDEKHYPIAIHFHSDRYYMAAIVDLTNGAVLDHGPRESSITITGLLPVGIDCTTLSGSILSLNISGEIEAIGYPSCLGLRLNLRIKHPSNKHRVYGDILLDIISRRVNTDINEYWVNDCLIYSGNPQCSINEEHCTQGMETRIIGGLPITRACWATEAKYTCAFSSSVEDTCKPLRDKGCEQIGSTCTAYQENQCVLYNQTFRCPKKDCTYQTLCTTIPTCIDGDCSQHEKNPDPDFNQAVGSFGALIEAAKEMDKNSQMIFAGKAMSCSKAPIGFLNCCGDGGWGEILNFKCDKDEIELHHLTEEKHLTIEIPGDYCGKKIGEICLSYRKRYCVFPTKIARLIQIGGRLVQLKRKFGTPSEPNCSGLTPEDLQHIDFSQIDFSEIVEDLKNSIPPLDQAALVERMNKNIQEAVDKNYAN